MSLSLIDYGTRADALEGAELAGYTPDVVRVAKLDSGRYQWDLRDFGDLASVPDGTAGELSELTDRLNRLGEIDQDAYREVAHEAFYAETCRVMREGADTLLAGVGAAVERVIQDGAIGVDAEGRQWGVVAMPDADVAAFDCLPRDMQIALAQEMAQPVEAVEVVHPVPAVEAADVELRLPGMLTESAAREYAAWHAGRLGHPVEMVRGGVVIGTVFPPTGGARKVRAPRVNGGGDVVATEGGGHLARAIAMLNKAPPVVRAERDWLTYRRDEIPQSNASCRKTWDIIDAAGRAMDMETLQAMTFAGSDPNDGTGNTYTRNNGRFRLAWIARVEAMIREAEAAEEASASEAADRQAANAAAVAELLSAYSGDD